MNDLQHVGLFGKLTLTVFPSSSPELQCLGKIIKQLHLLGYLVTYVFVSFYASRSLYMLLLWPVIQRNTLFPNISQITGGKKLHFPICVVSLIMDR